MHQALVEHPSVAAFLSHGYTYLYIPDEWWYTLASEEQSDLSQPCVHVVAERSDIVADKTVFRRLVDVSACSP